MRKRAAMNTAVEPLPGMPRARLGMRAPTLEALLATSAAMMPSGTPVPKSLPFFSCFLARS